MSPARFDRYTRVVPSGDVRTALKLYRWNSRLAAATLEECWHVEVALRNAYDRELSVQHPNWSIDPASSLFDHASARPVRTAQELQRLNRRSKSDLAYARQGLGSTATHGQMVAGLMFGFWTQLTVRARTEQVWTPMLSRCFPRGTSRGAAHGLVESVNKFRNRLAHSEPTFTSGTGYKLRRAKTFELLSLIEPWAATWVEENSEVGAILDGCPLPSLVATMK